MDVLLPFALILVAFYFLIIRPQRTRSRQAAQLQERLAPGVEIMTTAGIFGTVTEVRDDSVVLEIAPGSTLRVAKAAVGRVLAEDATDATDEADEIDLTDPADDPVDNVDDASDDTDAGTGRRSPSGE